MKEGEPVARMDIEEKLDGKKRQKLQQDVIKTKSRQDEVSERIRKKNHGITARKLKLINMKLS